jgi:hypothetical protein
VLAHRDLISTTRTVTPEPDPFTEEERDELFAISSKNIGPLTARLHVSLRAILGRNETVGVNGP